MENRLLTNEMKSFIKSRIVLPINDLSNMLLPLSAVELPESYDREVNFPIINNHMHFSKGLHWINIQYPGYDNPILERVGNRMSTNRKIELIRRWLDALKFDKILVMTEQGGFRDDKTEKMVQDEIEANKEVEWICSQFPDRLIPIATAHPGYGSWKNIETFLKKDFKGIKFHPYHLRIDADDPVYDPYMEIANKYHVPVQVHCGLSPKADPDRIIKLSSRHPNVPMVLIHTTINSNGYTSPKQILEVIDTVSKGIKRGQELFVDLSCHSAKNYPICKAIDKLGSDRIIFGTDGNLDDNRWLRQIPEKCISFVKTIRDQGYKEDVIKKIFYLNAVNLYRINNN